MAELLLDVVTALALVSALFFFTAGSLGALRFPDVYTRLHAMTKADNMGCGLVVLGLSLQADGWLEVVRLLLIWSFVLVAGAVAAHLIARTARSSGVTPWR